MRRLAAGALVALVAYRLRTSYLKERAKIVRIADVPEPAADLLRRLGWTAHVEEHLESRIRPSARAAGDKPKHPLVLVPGIISCGLELWRPGACYGRGWFRERLWGGLGMARAAVKNISCWLDHISLNATTGLDRDGHEVRAALGWSGAEYFAPGYWLWAKVLANAAEVGYDRSSMHMACYDWRLSFRNLERRDGYLSRLKAEVEVLTRQRGEKAVVVGHSMGAALALFFFSWCEAGDPGWVDAHVHAFVSLGGSLLGAVGPLGAILSGEMKATAMLGKVNELIDSQMSFLNKTQQRDIYRSLGALGALLPKGGDAVWGGDVVTVRSRNRSDLECDVLFCEEGAENATAADDEALGVDAIRRGLAADLPRGASILDYDPAARRPRRTATGAGLWPWRARPRAAAAAERRLAAASENPLNAALPAAPKMTVYCLYGTGIDTERRYHYARRGPGRHAADLGTIDYERADSGVESGDGDGTVPLASLGYPCYGLWRDAALAPIYNPSNVRTVVREYPHDACPIWQDPRGGTKTSRHVEILGNYDVIRDILDVATGHEDTSDRVTSDLPNVSANITAGLRRVLGAGGS